MSDKYWSAYHDHANCPEYQNQIFEKGNPLRDPDFRIVAHMSHRYALIRHVSGKFYTVDEDTYPEIPEVSESVAKRILENCREGNVDSIAYFKAKVERAQGNLLAEEKRLSDLDELLRTLAEVQADEPPSPLVDDGWDDQGSDTEQASEVEVLLEQREPQRQWHTPQRRRYGAAPNHP